MTISLGIEDASGKRERAFLFTFLPGENAPTSSPHQHGVHTAAMGRDCHIIVFSFHSSVCVGANIFFPYVMN